MDKTKVETECYNELAHGAALQVLAIVDEHEPKVYSLEEAYEREYSLKERLGALAMLEAFLNCGIELEEALEDVLDQYLVEDEEDELCLFLVLVAEVLTLSDGAICGNYIMEALVGYTSAALIGLREALDEGCVQCNCEGCD